MYDFQFSENFEPTKNTKKWALYTHKSTSTFAHLQLPGLFQTTYYEWQIFGVIGIFLVEGLAVSTQGGVEPASPLLTGLCNHPYGQLR